MARRKRKHAADVKMPHFDGPNGRNRTILDNGFIEQGNAREINDFVPGYKFTSTWSSPEAFARHIGTLDRNKSWTDSGWEKGEGPSEDWYGADSMGESLELAQNGWKEGAEQVERVRDYIQAMHPTTKRPKRYGIAGAYPDVPRAVAGNILNMHIPDSARNRKRPVITLVSNMACNWTISSTVLSNRAAAIAAMVDQIEGAGFACEVISGAASEGYSWGRKSETEYRVNTAVVVKTCDQPVDTTRLAFGLGHASMFRRMIFADWGAEESAEKGLGSGLGYSQKGIQISDETREEKHVYNIPSTEDTSSLWKTEEDAAQKGLPYLLQALKAQKCPPFMGVKLPELDVETQKLYDKNIKKKNGELPDYDDDDYDD